MKEYRLTRDQFDILVGASMPLPLMMLQLEEPKPAIERVRDEWVRLGERMGFDPMTVESSGKNDRIFFAEPVTMNKEEK